MKIGLHRRGEKIGEKFFWRDAALQKKPNTVNEKNSHGLKAQAVGNRRRLVEKRP